MRWVGGCDGVLRYRLDADVKACSGVHAPNQCARFLTLHCSCRQHLSHQASCHRMLEAKRLHLALVNDRYAKGTLANVVSRGR